MTDEPRAAGGFRGPDRAGPNLDADRLCIRDGGAIRLVPVDSIVWIEAESNYVRIHTEDDAHLTRGTLSAFQAALEARGFARGHRSFLVNLQAVRELRAIGSGDYRALLVDGRQLTVTRTYSDEFLQRLERSTFGPPPRGRNGASPS